MAYDKADITKKVLDAIKKENLTFFSDLEAYVEPAMSTLYEWDLDKSEDIKRALSINKIKSKKKMRRNWEDSENPTLQIAAYKLLATQEELEKITMSKVSNEHTGANGGPIQTENKHVVEFQDFTDDKTEV